MEERIGKVPLSRDLCEAYIEMFEKKAKTQTDKIGQVEAEVDVKTAGECGHHHHHTENIDAIICTDCNEILGYADDC